MPTNRIFKKSNITLALILTGVALAVGVSASYKEPIAPWPTNTIEPIDTGMANQAKVGPLSVFAFFARGNADFKKDLQIDGIVQGGQPTNDPVATTVAIASNTLVTGDLYALDRLQADSLKHNESAPKRVCGDENGIVVFCSTPPPPVIADVCPDGVPGNPQGIQTANSDIEVDPATGKCTQIIRGTIAVGQYGPIVRNRANTAELGSLWITGLSISSVGGQPTSTWPSTTPLMFRWGYCSGWNPNYTGPGVGTGAVFFNTQGSLTSGYCANFQPSYPFRLADLIYGFSGQTSNEFIPYVAYDGVTQIPNTFSGVAYPKGFFAAAPYELTGSKTTAPAGYTLNLWYKKGTSTPEYRIIKFPVEKLILYDVKVPDGYRLELAPSSVSAQSVVVHPIQ